jgi:hypothetical protein
MSRQPPQKPNPFLGKRPAPSTPDPVKEKTASSGHGSSTRPLYVLAAACGALALVAIIVLGLIVRNRQDTISSQETTQRAQQATITAQATAVGTQRAQIAIQHAQIVALQTQVATLRAALSGGPVTPPPLEPLLDQAWLALPLETTLLPSPRSSYNVLSFRFALQNELAHPVPAPRQKQVLAYAADVTDTQYAMTVTPLQGTAAPARSVPSHARVLYRASGALPANATGVSVTIEDSSGTSVSFTKR